MINKIMRAKEFIREQDFRAASGQMSAMGSNSSNSAESRKKRAKKSVEDLFNDLNKNNK
jgi:hypothetical protein